jgi:hypothetical protein
MTRRERIYKTLRGEPTDRPPVNFYEINGLDENPSNPDAYNIYNHASWKPLLDLAREKTDRLVMRGAPFIPRDADPLAERTTETIREEGASRVVTRTLRLPGRTLTSQSRRDAAVNTWWTTEHLLKDPDDLKALLEIPPPSPVGTVSTESVLRTEAALGDTGAVMLDTFDPLCLAASQFEMGTYTVIALTEPALFRRLLDHYASWVLPATAAVAEALPGRLWRIYGPEYAAPPYLPPALFKAYVVDYVKPMVAAIQQKGGFARIHCHGRLRAILDLIALTGCDGLDPIEPPPQGDVSLAEVRQARGREWVLFGNLEISDIETLPTDLFRQKVSRALDEGTAGEGRGFVLQPSSCPYGREVSDLTLRNYETIIKMMELRYPGTF